MGENSEMISNYFHCKKCLEQLPEGTSPRDWARINVGFTQLGVQVWCTRHDKEIVHIDFLGQKVAYVPQAKEDA